MFVLLMATFSLAFAEQTVHQIKPGKNSLNFQQQWSDSEKETHRVSFSLDKKLVDKDNDTPLQFNRQQAALFVAKRVNEWAQKNGYRVTAKAVKGKVNIQVSGKITELAPLMKRAIGVRKDAYNAYFEQHFYTKLRMPFHLRSGIVPDHVALAEQYSDSLNPLVKALGGATPDPRDFGNKALSYVQSIPYEQRALVSDRYRRPLSVVAKNQGDCDSKSVLFLALMRAAYPEMEMGMVYIRGHAFAAVDISPQLGETRFWNGLRRWMAVEPVGPAIKPLGKISFKSKVRTKLQLYRFRSLDAL